MALRYEWVYKFAVPLAALALLPSLVGLRAYSHQATKLRGAVQHLCALQKTTLVVYRSAVVSYSTLPNKTRDQIRLYAALRHGVAEIEADRTCDQVH